MDINTMIYSIVAVVVAIISATIMRAKSSDWDRFDIGDAFLCILFGVVWPLTIVAGVVYLASGFLYRRFYKKER